jgi:hypothetical protein
MDDLYSKRYDMQNITAKSLEQLRARANMDDLISSTDSFPAAAAYQFAQVAVFCNIEQNASEVSRTFYQGQHGAEHHGYGLRVLG